MQSTPSHLAAARYLNGLGIRHPGYNPTIGGDTTLTVAVMRAIARRKEPKPDRFATRSINSDLATAR